MKALMVHVERAVRPVRAQITTKMTMREELLGHLEEIYRDERTRHPDDDSAIEAACRRFGPSGELTISLQSSVPASERVTAAIDSWFRNRPEESRLRQASRITGYAVSVSAGTTLFTLLIIAPLMMAIGRPLHGLTSAMMPGTLTIVFKLTLMMAANAFLLSLMAAKAVEQMSGPTTRPRSLRIALLLAVAAAGSIVASLSLWQWSLSWEPSPLPSLLPRWAALSTVMVLVLAGVARAVALEDERVRPWSTLDLSESSPA